MGQKRVGGAAGDEPAAKKQLGSRGSRGKSGSRRRRPVGERQSEAGAAGGNTGGSLGATRTRHPVPAGKAGLRQSREEQYGEPL